MKRCLRCALHSPSYQLSKKVPLLTASSTTTSAIPFADLAGTILRMRCGRKLFVDREQLMRSFFQWCEVIQWTRKKGLCSLRSFSRGLSSVVWEFQCTYRLVAGKASEDSSFMMILLLLIWRTRLALSSDRQSKRKNYGGPVTDALTLLCG